MDDYETPVTEASNRST